MSEACAFCAASVLEQTLWEGERYRILADAYPRCAGHVLLVSKAHLASHMHAPDEWLPEFLDAQERVRRFLIQAFGRAAFYENGGRRQEVPHAHLHGLPFAPDIPAAWEAEEQVRRIEGWEEARQECRAAGFYYYLESASGRFLVADRRYKRVLRETRNQLVGQTEAALDADGKMLRGGVEMVQRTRALWRQYEQD